MLRFERSRQFKRHMKAEALKYAKAAAELAEKIDPEVRFQVFTGVFGSVERVFWVGDFEGIAALEKTLLKIESDGRWQTFMSTVPEGLFIEGSGQESIMRLAA